MRTLYRLNDNQMFSADMILGKRRIKVRVKSAVLRHGPRRRGGQGGTGGPREEHVSAEEEEEEEEKRRRYRGGHQRR